MPEKAATTHVLMPNELIVYGRERSRPFRRLDQNRASPLNPSSDTGVESGQIAGNSTLTINCQ